MDSDELITAWGDRMNNPINLYTTPIAPVFFSVVILKDLFL
jgi:hypothetical protein